MDGEISARLMKLAGRHPLLDHFWVFCARYLIVVLGFGMLWSIWNTPERSTRGVLVLMMLAAIIVNETISWGIGYFRFRPRPFVNNHLTPLVRIAPGMKSFPSDHAVISFTVATLVLVWWLLGAPAIAPLSVVAMFLTAGLISGARVVCGVHYPSDVLAGGVLGVLGTLGVGAVFLAYVGSS